jgi:3-mercaptopyruvate sulfurtransferase SseA
MKGKGFKKVFALKGGWNKWFEAGFPTEQKEKQNAALPR